MNHLRTGIATLFLAICVPAIAGARVWTDSTGQYTLDATLVMSNDKSVVLQREDHQLVAIPIEKLSEKDREFLKSKDASEAVKANNDIQHWKMKDGSELVGRIVEYASRDITLQRRRGRIYVNDRPLENLPEFYQLMLPKIVAHFEPMQRADQRGLESWMVRQRAQARTFHLDGVVLETANGDEYGIPFFLFSDEDAKVLKAGWEDWLPSQRDNDYTQQEDHAFLLKSLAAARHRDSQVQQRIAMMQLKLEAVQAGVTSLWEVTLYPAAGRGGAPQWVVVSGRDSRQATATALERNPGYVAGPVRQVSN